VSKQLELHYNSNISVPGDLLGWETAVLPFIKGKPLVHYSSTINLLLLIKKNTVLPGI
jgi:hypothetical protein